MCFICTYFAFKQHLDAFSFEKDVLDAVKMAQVACNGVVEVSLWFTSLMWTSCIIQSASSYESVTDAH